MKVRDGDLVYWVGNYWFSKVHRNGQHIDILIAKECYL